jgi:perosamine synthetase
VRQHVPADRTHAWHLYPVRLAGDAPAPARAAMHAALRARGILANVHYRPVHLHSYWRGLGHAPGECPVAERAYDGLLSLPMWHGLTDADQDRVIEAVLEEVAVHA